MKGFKLIQDLFKKSIALFTENGIFDEIHTDPGKTIIHTIFTDNDSNIDFQEAHTEYDYLPRQTDSETPPHSSWTAHMPITNKGSWITLWFGTGAGYTMHIPYGMVLLLRSDVDKTLLHDIHVQPPRNFFNA